MDQIDSTLVVNETGATELELLELELEAENAEAERIAKETADKYKLDRKRAELEAAKVRVADQKLLAEAEAELGVCGKEWDQVPHRLGAIIVKKPNHMRHKRWQDDGMKTTTTALETLVKPELWRMTWKEYCHRVVVEPLTTLRSAAVMNRLAGARAEELEGK